MAQQSLISVYDLFVYALLQSSYEPIRREKEVLLTIHLLGRVRL